MRRREASIKMTRSDFDESERDSFGPRARSPSAAPSILLSRPSARVICR